ncbi:helix-turn-helix domain-containing protein [Actinomadura rupiterrae]|uniref:helix-turn-helix domain-containing protein n=1 Tax=Actinomadura rupiterrae TaxID=559627 RepID=UPI0020A41F04|nr:helix-turn-helix domain-containing protein [Actinomadura rupiterrae]MCP2341515.1 AraC-like DNA-binding protein [Actinomadura rupiterrae]
MSGRRREQTIQAPLPAGEAASALEADTGVVRSYVERLPEPGLAALVQTVWVHRTEDVPYVQRRLPAGGVDLHWPLGGEPQLLGPLTGPALDIVPARTTIVGIRFRPGSNPLLPVAPAELLDQWVTLRELGHRWVDQLGEAMMNAPTPEAALALLQARLLQEMRAAPGPDRLMDEAVRLLMPWQRAEVGVLASHLGLSASQLRRRCLHVVGVSPKVLQRTLRFQGFLALAQAATTPLGQPGAESMAGFATDVGYADQSHLTRECLRLAGVTPSALFGGEVDRCLREHDHAASYRSFLASRRTPRRRL